MREKGGRREGEGRVLGGGREREGEGKGKSKGRRRGLGKGIGRDGEVGFERPKLTGRGDYILSKKIPKLSVLRFVSVRTKRKKSFSQDCLRRCRIQE